MNIIDSILIILLIIAIIRGKTIGLVRLACSAAGFLGGLYIASRLIGRYHASLAGGPGRMVLLLFAAFAVALIIASIGEIIGVKIQASAQKLHLGIVDKVLGAVFEVLFVLLVTWLLGSSLANINSGGMGAVLRSSVAMRTLNATLPAPPDILAELAQIAGANGFPNVFVGNEPNPKSVAIDNAALRTPEVKAALASVYKIEGNGCGGIVEGSGFAIANDLVATNAHVVAGIDKPSVIVDGRAVSSQVVVFDKNTDFAVLKIPKTMLTPLYIDTAVAANGTPVAIAGYPGGGPLTVDAGAILEHITAIGRNIYNRGLVSRQIYEVQGTVNPGNSGGPILDAHGHVVGVVFAKSVSNDSVGYALLTSDVQAEIQQASSATTPLNTGRCAD